MKRKTRLTYQEDKIIVGTKESLDKLLVGTKESSDKLLVFGQVISLRTSY